MHALSIPCRFSHLPALRLHRSGEGEADGQRLPEPGRDAMGGLTQLSFSCSFHAIETAEHLFSYNLIKFRIT
jgi:hypothetical protein